MRISRALKKVDKFERDLNRVGGQVDGRQLEFCRDIAADRQESHQEWMYRMVAVRLERGDFSDWTGWEYRNEWAVGSYHPAVPRWRLEPIESLAVLGEQGIGDEVMYASCLPDAIARLPKVTVECDPRLVGVFSRSFGIEARPRADITHRGENLYLNVKRPEQMLLPIGDLPRLFRKSIHAFPRAAFLKPLPAMVQKWRHLAGKTGIAWRGRSGVLSPNDIERDGAVCLQYDYWDNEVAGMIVPDCDLHADIEDVLGILANLDRVVTVGQTIVHLAGAIGTPVDVVLAPIGTGRIRNEFNWRYGLRDMPWYPSVTVYRNLGEYLHRRTRPVS